MQGRKVFSPQLFYQTSQDNLVPRDNFYRLVNQQLDLHYLYGATKQYYGSEGQESTDTWIPNFGQYKPEREGFVFNEILNPYECQKEGGNGAVLSYKGIKMDSKGYERNRFAVAKKTVKLVHCMLNVVGKRQSSRSRKRASINLFTIVCTRN